MGHVRNAGRVNVLNLGHRAVAGSNGRVVATVPAGVAAEVSQTVANSRELHDAAITYALASCFVPMSRMEALPLRSRLRRQFEEVFRRRRRGRRREDVEGHPGEGSENESDESGSDESDYEGVRVAD